MRHHTRRQAAGLALAGGLLAAAGPGRADPPAPAKAPAADPDTDTLWDWLQGTDDEKATRAVLALSKRPAVLVVRAGAEAKPLLATPAEVRGKLQLLGDPDEAVWKPAFEWLEYYDPRLAIGLEELMKEVTEAPTRQRLTCVLSGRDYKYVEHLGKDEVTLRPVGEGFNFSCRGGSWWAEPKIDRLGGNGWGNPKRKWTRLTRTVALLEHVGTPAAVTLIRGVAGGHPDAFPTKAAKAAVERLAKK